LIGYLYNYLMEISALFTGNRKLLSKMKIIESKIDNLLKNRQIKSYSLLSFEYLSLKL
jgi:hypothetical protein